MKTITCTFTFVLVCSAYAAWIDQYNTNWTSPGLTETGSLPIGNGDLTANVFLQQLGTTTSYDLYFVFGKSDSYDLTSERLKLIQLSLSYDPPISSDKYFEELLFVSNGTVSINTMQYQIQIWIDINSNVLNVETTNINPSNVESFTVTSNIYSWRKGYNYNAGAATGDSFCYNPNVVPIMPDTIVQNGCDNSADSVIFYHRNVNPTNEGMSQFTWNMIEQQFASLLPDFHDPFYNLTFGGVLSMKDAVIIANNTLSGNYTDSNALTFTFLTSQTDTFDEWLDELCNTTANYKSKENNNRKLHDSWWSDFWNRSTVQISSGDINNSTMNEQTYLISLLYTHQRYLDALDGRGKNLSIKFNGQSFTVDVGNGPDYKSWGSSFWWQNTRQPYYNTLVANDIDLNVAFYNHYLNQLPLIQARNKIYYNHSGGFFGETAQFTGLYQESGLGYNCKNGTAFNPYAMNSYIRFHWVGGVELINMMLDQYDWYLDDSIIEKYVLPISDVILTHYIEHYPPTNESGAGKMDMFPAQSLETWQCPKPDRADCVTNPTEQIAGLMVVSERLLKLPGNFGTNDQRVLWGNVKSSVPDIPLMQSHSTTIVSPGKLLPPSHSNSENSELYTVHPFRIYQWFKPNLTLASNTYKYRRFPCNDGWCQDILDAAMLGMTTDAQNMVISRAQNSKNGFKWKWDGFAGHFQDYEPSLDHLSFMRTAIHYMLIQNNFETNEIYLFPSWPCEWAVSFKLWAKNKTSVFVDYDGKGTAKLVVEPQDRANDAKFVNCVS